MSKNDARKLNLAELHERRKEVVRLHCEGHAVMKIVRMTGMSWPAVRSAIDRYESGGTDAIKPAVRGRRDGDGRSLTEQQEGSMRELICTRRPDQLGLSETMWSRSSVDQLIQRECTLRLSERAVGNYVNRWGFSAAAPLPQQPQSDDEGLTAWLRSDYRALVQRARSEKSEIQWLQTRKLPDGEIDKQDVNSSIVGERPVHQRHVLFAVSNQRKTRWLVSPGTPDNQQWATFLDALTAEVGDSILIQPSRSFSGAVNLAPNAALFDTRPIVRVVAGEVALLTRHPAVVTDIQPSVPAAGVALREFERQVVLGEDPSRIAIRKTGLAALMNDTSAARSTSIENDRNHLPWVEAAQSKLRGPPDRSFAGSIRRIRAIAAVAIVAAIAAIAAVGATAVVITSRPATLLDSESGHEPRGIGATPTTSDDDVDSLPPRRSTSAGTDKKA